MLRNSASWRDRAEEYRAFAESAKDAQVRAGYLQLARHCESLAQRHERYVHELCTQVMVSADPNVETNDEPWQDRQQSQSSWKSSAITSDRGAISVPGVLKN